MRESKTCPHILRANLRQAQFLAAGGGAGGWTLTSIGVGGEKCARWGERGGDTVLICIAVIKPLGPNTTWGGMGLFHFTAHSPP